MKFAVVRTGGKQYKVREGQLLRVEKLPGEVGSSLELGDVLLVGEGDAVTVGTPVVSGAKVRAEIVRQGKAAKVMLFKYKPGGRGLKRGHRQPFTQIKVVGIEA
jgi:large subunit ribosomal protein L21